MPLVGVGLAMGLRVLQAPEALAIGAFVFFAMILPFVYQRVRRTDGGADLLARFEPVRVTSDNDAAAEARIADVIGDLDRNAELRGDTDPDNR